MPESNPQLEAELAKGFLERKPAAESAFIERLRPYMRQVIRGRFPSLWRWSEDLQQSALLRLCELRADPSKVDRIRPPLEPLAVYLVDPPARLMLKSKKRFGGAVEVREWDASHAPNQQNLAYLKELWRLLPRLSFNHARTLQIHAAHEVGDGPSLHEALGITKDAAKRKLLDAQDALLTLSRTEVDHG
jgi:hypothetical protein